MGGLLALLFLNSCGFFSSKNEKEESSVKLIATNDSAMVGSIGDSSRTKFTYAFSIGQHEVTQAEFQKLMGYNPVTGANLQGADFPVVMVSWYEAAVFCNALSKSMGLDTVYSYSTMIRNSAGGIEMLDGVVVHFDVDGIRLPTEAEWSWAAQQDSAKLYPWGNDTLLAPNFSWGLGNANGALHDVCSLKKTGGGLCDMGGNALEYVEGWMGSLPADTLVDFVGSYAPNAAQERIVKGGSYRTGALSMQIYRRSDVYATYLGSRTEYLGFRVARGKISIPNYLKGDSVGSISGSPAQLVTSREEIQSFFGFTQVKLSFVNGTNEGVNYVDFSSYSLSLNEQELPTRMRKPVFSPDGKFVAYSTFNEGQSGASEVFVVPFGSAYPIKISAQPAFVPRWWVDTANTDTLLLFTDQASSNGDSVTWAKGSTFAVSVVGGIPQPTARTFATLGAFHDGASTDGRWLATGYTNLRVRDRSDSTTRTLFRSPLNGKDTLGSVQVCNVSMRPGSNPQLMFLDFGYEKTSTLVGGPYDVHQYIFVMDPATGAVTDWIKVPDGYQNWDHVQWSNHPGFAVASVTDSKDGHPAIFAIRMKDHALLKLVTGENVDFPTLWLNPLIPEDYIPNDSIFQYNTPSTAHSVELSVKLMRFWKQRGQIDLVCFGSSRGQQGFNPDYFTGYHGLNMAMSGMDYWSYFNIWTSYVKNHSPQVKKIVLELSLDFLYYRSSERWEPMWSMNYGYQYDKSHDFYVSGLPAHFDTLLQISSAITADELFTQAGYAPVESAGWGNPELGTWPEMTNHPESWKETLDSLDGMIQEWGDQGIQVLAVIMPQNPGYAGLGSWGRYGPTQEVANIIMDSIAVIKARHNNLTIFDQHLNGLHDYTDAEAANMDHLSTAGATKLSLRIDSVLQTLPQ